MSKTTTKERIIYGSVAVFMLLSTIGMYVAMVLANNNPQPTTPQQELNQKAMEKINKRIAAQMKWVNDKMSKKHYAEFSKYQQSVTKFDPAGVTKLEKKDLKVGSGEKITKIDQARYYYLGWLSDGTIFDGSIKDKKLSAPFPARSGGVIKGWEEGIIGMNKGGVRELTIPADLAYGDKAVGKIPANSPLKFIIMAATDLTKEELKNMPKVGS